uniref:Uncharacterized protein n=1 Tax=Pavo cristatus TaxID=9049 RepID=A0A8C9F8A5_PAVCR
FCTAYLFLLPSPSYYNPRVLSGCFPCLPCFHHSHLLFTYILASVPFLKALFVSFTFLVRIILKYEIHL